MFFAIAAGYIQFTPNKVYNSRTNTMYHTLPIVTCLMILVCVMLTMIGKMEPRLE